MTKEMSDKLDALHLPWMWGSNYGAFRKADLGRALALQYVGGVSGGSGYEWSEFRAWYDPSRRRYLWESGSGCSCNAFMDNIHSIDAMQIGNKQAMLTAFRKFAEQTYPEITSAQAIEAMQQMRTWSPS